MAYIVRVDERKYKVNLKQNDRYLQVFLDGKEHHVEIIQHQGKYLNLIIDNKQFNIICQSENQITVNNEDYTIELVDEKLEKLIKNGPEKFVHKELSIKAPMPGLILS